MSIEQEKVVDVLAGGRKPNEVVLFITDHLLWDDKSDYEHAIMLQKKLNSYLAFIESGEMEKKYPEHKGKEIIIHVIGRYSLNSNAKKFYEKVSSIISNAGFSLRFEHSKEK